MRGRRRRGCEPRSAYWRRHEIAEGNGKGRRAGAPKARRKHAVTNTTVRSGQRSSGQARPGRRRTGPVTDGPVTDGPVTAEPQPRGRRPLRAVGAGSPGRAAPSQASRAAQGQVSRAAQGQVSRAAQGQVSRAAQAQASRTAVRPTATAGTARATAGTARGTAPAGTSRTVSPVRTGQRQQPAGRPARGRDTAGAGRRPASRTPFILLVLGLLGGGLLCLGVINTTLSAASYKINALQQGNAQAAQRAQQLQQQVATEESPSAIEQRALRLGMKMQPVLDFIDLRNDRSYTTPAEGTGAYAVPGYTP